MDSDAYVYITILMVLFLVFTAAVSHGDTLIAWWRESSHYKRENAVLKRAVKYLYGYAKSCGVDADDIRDRFGIEVE